MIELFEDSVRYDAHSLNARVSRSWPGAELRRRGSENLLVIAEHLTSTQPEDHDWNMRSAWGLLLHWLQGDHHLQEGPKRNSDLMGWITWAKTNATT